MAKVKLTIQDEPVGKNLYIVGVVDSISKSKTVLVYSDHYMLDDHSNLVFVNTVGKSEDFIFAIKAGDWKTVIKYEDIFDPLKCVRIMTLQERLDELDMIALEKEENAKKAAELEEAILKAEEEAEAAKSKADALKESIKE